MKVTFRDWRGNYGGTWDGPGLVFDRQRVGRGETFEMISLDDPPPPDPPVTPVTHPYAPDFVGREREWFMGLVEGKPFGQQTLLEFEPTLKANGWLLTPPNAAGDRTKVGYMARGNEPVFPDGRTWVRVGFGEKKWVWLVQTP